VTASDTKVFVMARAVILTSHSDEYHAVRACLTHLAEETHSQGTVYELGRFSANEKVWEVAIAQVTEGNSDAAVETERAITYWQPNVVLSVGVATGLKDVTAGDVVAAIEVYGYESGNVTEYGFSPRPKIGLASYVLEQRAKASARNEDWLERIQGDRPNWTPQVFVGAIAAGEKEITSSQSEIYQFLQSNYGDALAVDVTGYGVLTAVHRNAGTYALIIRGITHVIDRDVTINQAAARKVAAQHASAFAFEILAKLEAPSALGLSPAQYTKLKQNLTDASKGLLSWRRTLNNNQQIERSELNELLNRVKTEESSTTIVLGVPGAGKSALMATLGNELIAQGYAVLAIKADQLNGAINTIEDLQHDLRLELHPSDAIHAIASKEQIVILMDQLDAVSELMDRKSQRLNLLLSLIQRLSGSKNVHIVATCREFDFRYGSQFARLAEIDRLDLSLPTWENISPILEASGHQTANMGEPLRELLQNPLHLSIFLDIAQPGDVFTSSQKLLDRLWEERVKKQSEPEKCIAFLEKLANQMTTEEVLWVPDAISDTAPEIWQSLEQTGLLITNPENATIGFRHQTYYDHTLARAFARGSQSLTDLVLERQDGLFVRPILLRGLNYLRGTSPKQYELELRKLLTNAEVNNCVLKNEIAKSAQQLLTHVPYNLRTKGFSILQALRLIYIRKHIYTLLVEFIGSQQNPLPVEVELLTSLLKLESESPKVLDAAIGSPGWFKSFRDRPEFTQWLEKPVEKAVCCCPLLTAAANFAAEDVWRLLEDYWLDNKAYDFLSIQVIWDIRQWTPERVLLIQQLIQRSNIDWHSVAAIAEKVAETLPDAAAKIIRAHLDYLLAQATEASKLPPPELPQDADEVQRSVHAYQYNSLNPLKALIEDESNLYEIEKFAVANPKSYLESIWLWFTNLIQQLACDANPLTMCYRWDHIGDFRFPRSEIIQSLLSAIAELAKQDKSAFLKFVEQNTDSDLLVVHRLLAFGLEVVATEEPTSVLNYLLADPRRLSLGSQMGSDRHDETEKLIAAIFPYLNQEDRERLEQTIQEFKYWQPSRDKDVDFRRRCLEYNREHRLSLLRAIPEQYLSSQIKRLKEEEERALPWFDLQQNSATISGGTVGPRMTKDEMSRATDQHLLNLFNELSDETAWHHPRRQWSDDSSRAGGAVQQSREFSELAKEDPSRSLCIFPQLEPHRHESYAGAVLVDLAKTDFPANALIHIIEELDRRGFASESFRCNVASALQEIAERNRGLPQSMLILLGNWLLPSQGRIRQSSSG
jgi:nucleoside phosphorylase